MTRWNRALSAGVLFASLSLTGCAATWDGPGPRLGVGVGSAPRLASSACGLAGTQPSPMTRMSSGSWISAVIPRIHALQARLVSGSAASTASWKQLATGDC